MSDDIVKRLRDYAGDTGHYATMKAAADEIERLREALERIAQYDMQAIAMDALRPGERIRAAPAAQGEYDSIKDSLTVWAPLIDRGLECPAAGQMMRNAAAITALQARAEAAERALAEAIAACDPREDEAWSREEMRYAAIIKERIAAIATPPKGGE